MIRSDSLRQQIINLFEVTYPYLMQETKRLEDQVWPAVVVPLQVKHLRNIDGNLTPVNYDNMLNDKEFINICNMRLGMRRSFQG
jgi:hypothetical protein